MERYLDSVGSVLQDKRLERGLTLDQCAQRLGIRRQYLEELEVGGCEVGADVYRREWLKAYSLHLGLLWEPLWKQLKEEKLRCQSVAPLAFTPSSTRHAPFLKKHRWSRYVAVASTFLIAMGYLGGSVYGLLTPPSLDVVSPVEHSLLTSSLLDIHGKSSPEAEVAINGKEVRLKSLDGTFRDTVSLHPGLNTIVITATKKRVWQTSIERHVFVEEPVTSVSQGSSNHPIP